MYQLTKCCGFDGTKQDEGKLVNGQTVDNRSVRLTGYKSFDFIYNKPKDIKLIGCQKKLAIVKCKLIQKQIISICHNIGRRETKHQLTTPDIDRQSDTMNML